MPRVSIVDPESSDELKRIAAGIFKTRRANIIGASVPSVFGVLFHRPAIAECFSVLGNELRHKGILPDRVRDLTILQVSRLNRTAYLWHVHLEHAVSVGLDRDSLYRLDDPQPPHFDERDRAVLAYARAMTKDVVVPQSIYDAAAKHFSEAEMVELSALVAFYNFNTRLLLALGIENEEGRPRVRLPFEDPLA